MAGLLIVNPRAGDEGSKAAEIVHAASKRGLEVHVLRDGEEPADAARGAPDGPLGIAGGDGSLGPVATVAIERGLPFVCVPLGTRNHFARDVGLDRSAPVRALDAFSANRREARIDVGRASDRVVLNNVSLGLSAHLVHRRERRRRPREVAAAARALALAARGAPLSATVDREPLPARIIVVANNHYRLDLFSLGERERLDEGLLHLYAAAGLLPGTWQERTGERFLLDVAGHRVQAAVDGEPVELETPIEFRIEPQVLRLLLPPHTPARERQ